MGLGSLSKTLFSWVVIVICWLVLTPLLAYFLYRFLQYRQAMAFYNRSVISVIALNIPCLCSSIFIVPIYALYACEMIPASKGMDMIRNYLLWSALFSHGCALVWRVWHLRYNLEEVYHRKQISWQHIIDETQSGETDWYLQHKKTWGNPKYTIRFIATYGIVACFVQCFIVTLRIYGFVPITVSGGLALLWLPAFIIVVVRLWCKTSPFHDSIYIRKEMAYYTIMYSSGLIVWVIFMLGMSALGASFFTFNIFVCIASTIAIIPTGLIATGLLLIKADWNLAKAQTRGRQVTLTGKAMSRTDTLTGKLPELLRDNNGFETFMMFCVDELSTECLVSVVEFVQFKRAINKLFRLQGMASIDATNCVSEVLNFADCVPLSSIVVDIVNYRTAVAKQTESGGGLSVNLPTGDIEIRTDNTSDDTAMQTSTAIELGKVSGVSPRETSIGDTPFKTAELSPPPGDMGADASPPPPVKEPSFEFQVDSSVTGTHRDLCNAICKKVARRLFNKYIEDGSPYQINISARHRLKMIAMLRDEAEWKANDDITENELYSIFDECIEDMYGFLLTSFRRFTATDAFQKFIGRNPV